MKYAYVCVSGWGTEYNYQIKMILSSESEASKWKYSGLPSELRDYFACEIKNQCALSNTERFRYNKWIQGFQIQYIRCVLDSTGKVDIEFNCSYDSNDLDLQKCTFYEKTYFNPNNCIIWQGIVYIKEHTQSACKSTIKKQILQHDFEYWKKIAVPISEIIKMLK